MEPALRAALLANAAISALIEANPKRIAWGLVGPGKFASAIGLHRATGGFDYVMDGPVDTVTPLVDVHCLAGDYAAAATLADAVVAACASFTADPFQGVEVEDRHDDPAELSDGPASDRSQTVFRTILQVRPCFTPA
jgi:hypothetical protein